MPDTGALQNHFGVQLGRDKIGVVVLVVGKADEGVELSRGIYPRGDSLGIFLFPCHEAFQQV